MTLTFSVDPSLEGQRFKVETASRAPVDAIIRDIEGLPPGAVVGNLLQWDGAAWILVDGGAADTEVLTWDAGTQTWGPAASAALPPGTAVGNLLQWDGAAWVVVDGGANDGDVLTWDAGTSEWVAVAPGADLTAWDTIVQVLGDLPAPVAGVIDLTSGSYAFKNAIALGVNRLRVAAGQSVLLKGMGATKILSGAGSSLIEVAGDAIFETLVTLASAGPAVLLVAGGRMRAWSCAWESSSAQGLEQTGGVLDDLQTRYTGATDAYEITGGESHLASCNLTGGTGSAMVATGAGLGSLGVTFNGCRCLATAADCIEWNVTGTDLFFTDTDVRCTQASGTCIRLLAASSVQFVGGEWSTDSASPGNGLVIQLGGGAMGGLQIVGVSGEDISSGDVSGESFILYTSGSVRRATIQGCNTAVSVPTTVNWTAFFMPALGLSLVGNLWDDPNPYVGFSQFSPRVNAKANIDAGGLMGETPIIP